MLINCLYLSNLDILQRLYKLQDNLNKKHKKFCSLISKLKDVQKTWDVLFLKIGFKGTVKEK